MQKMVILFIKNNGEIKIQNAYARTRENAVTLTTARVSAVTLP
jgi:hypothetical protein